MRHTKKAVSNTFLLRVLAGTVLSAAFILIYVFWPAAISASPDMIFSDNFDPDSSNLTNGWKSFSGSSAPSRVTDSWIRVGSSGRGMRIDGSSSINPDDGAEREIVTEGYSSLKIEYSRAVNGFEGSDEFVAQYALDEGTFVTLETLTVDQGHITTSFDVPNLDRKTKLTLRFLVNANDSDDRAAVDNVEVTGDNAPNFYEGFESGGFIAGDWVLDGDVSVIHDSIGGDKIWTDDNSTDAGHSTGEHETKAHGAQLKADGDSNPGDGVLIKARSMLGYENIKVRYARRVSNLESGESFRSYYSVNGGTSWISLETITGVSGTNDDDVPFASVKFGPLDGVDNNPDFRIKFEVNGSSGSDNMFLDDVVIWGEPISTGSITIIKDADPDDPQDFTFIRDFGSNFLLDDDTDVTLSNAVTFSGLSAGTYSITELAQAGWQLTDIVCDDGSGADLGTRTATISLSEEEQVSCTFTNTKKGHLIVQKTTLPSADPTVFVINASGSGTITNGGVGTVTDSADKDYEVTPGTYSVAETVPAGWDKTGDTCQNVEVAKGETKTCLITNVKRGHIIVDKVTVGGDDTFSFDSDGGSYTDFSLTGASLPNDQELVPGNYSVSETSVPAGWDSDGGVCDQDQTPGSIVLAAGEIVTCTFTNTQRASLSLEKISDPDNGSFQVEITGPQSFSAFNIFTPSGIWNLSDMLPGDYSLFETVISPEDWSGLQAIACTGRGENNSSGSLISPFALTLSPGEAMSCVVNNTQDAVVIGKKFEDMDAEGDADIDDQGLSGWTITATDMDSEDTFSAETDIDGAYTLRLPTSTSTPTTYMICESQQEGWTESYPTESMEGASLCDDESEGYTLSVGPGAAISGKDFGNYRPGSISGTKFEDTNGNGLKDEDESGLEEWTIYLFDGTATTTTYTDEDGFYEFTDLSPGTYTISEEEKEGWLRTMPADSASYDVSLISGQEATEKDFGNFRPATVSGFKWNDKDGDGIRDFNDANENQIKNEEEEYTEPGLPDVTVALGRQNGEPRQENGHEIVPIEIIAMSLTSVDGGFTLSGVAPGHYKLFEENKSGWQATNPAPRADSFFDITYRIDLEPQQKPLVQDSFFDVFVEFSGQNVSQSGATQTIVTTVPSVPLEFGNHKLLVISQEAASQVEQTSVIIQWTTDFPGTSRVIYDTVAHAVLGSVPNYGYVNSTATFDESPKVTNHSVSLSGLTAGTTYFYRTISSASPESVSGEGSFTTSNSSDNSGGSGGGGGGGSGGGGGGGGGGLPPDAFDKPLGPFSILINSGSAVTPSREVRLDLQAGAKIKSMAISSYFSDLRDAALVDYKSNVTWDLCSKLGGAVAFSESECPEGMYTVYARFYSPYGQPSEVVSDTIEYRKSSIAVPPAPSLVNEVSSPTPFSTGIPVEAGGTEVSGAEVSIESSAPKVATENVIPEAPSETVPPKEAEVVQNPNNSLLATVVGVLSFGTYSNIFAFSTTVFLFLLLVYAGYYYFGLRPGRKR